MIETSVLWVMMINNTYPQLCCAIEFHRDQNNDISFKVKTSVLLKAEAHSHYIRQDTAQVMIEFIASTIPPGNHKPLYCLTPSTDDGACVDCYGCLMHFLPRRELCFTQKQIKYYREHYWNVKSELTHSRLYKMAAILQMIFSYKFPALKMHFDPPFS